MSDTQTRLLALLTGHFSGFETAESDLLDAQFIRDLKPDSLDVIEVLMLIEDEFRIVIGDDEAEALSTQITLREIVALIEGKLELVA